MRCILMNKNREILTAEYNTITKGFYKIYEIKNMEFAPLILNYLYTNKRDDFKLLEQFTEWIKVRCIPS